MLAMVDYMQAKYVVITAPTRDDLFDGGAQQFRRVTEHIKAERPEIKLELLIPDFANQKEAFEEIIAAEPDMICFDIQTVKALYKWVRPGFSYEKALDLFKYFSSQIKNLKKEIGLKSGLMLGLGETKDEIIELMQDLYTNGVRYLTMGQYLQAPGMPLPVIEYIEEDTYKFYREKAKEIGLWIQASPLTRSSYLADHLYNHAESNV